MHIHEHSHWLLLQVPSGIANPHGWTLAGIWVSVLPSHPTPNPTGHPFLPTRHPFNTPKGCWVGSVLLTNLKPLP